MKKNIKTLVRLTKQSKEMEIIYGQIWDMINRYYCEDTSKLGIAIDDMVDKAKKIIDMIDDKIIEVEKELGF